MESNSSNSITTNDDQRRDSEEIDYLSYMPMDILLHIFSFLPLKFWVLMCLVSKRWKYLWTRIPFLDLNQSVMVRSILKRNLYCSLCEEHHNYHGLDHDCHLHLRKEATKKFFSVVDRILLHHDYGCPITRFSLCIDYNTLKGYTSRINTWVDFAMRSNIESLELNFSGGQMLVDHSRTLLVNLNMLSLYRFKYSSFAPKRVKDLTLVGCLFDVHAFAALNSLQSLTFFEVDISGCRIGEILFICPLLKTLKLERCAFRNDFMICEEETKIKEMFLIDCMGYTEIPYPINIIAPSLTTLTISGHLISSSIKKSTKLVNAEVVLQQRTPFPADLGNCMAALLRDMSQCQYLELNSWFIQVLRDILPTQLPPKFKNLTNLRLKMYMYKQELHGLAYLISCCPNLETLNLDTDLPVNSSWFENIQTVGFDIEAENFWESQPFQLRCLQNSLKKVNMNGFSGRQIEMNIVKFLMGNAMVLEEMNIFHAKATSSVSVDQMIAYVRLIIPNCDLIRNFIKASPDVRIKIEY